MTDLGRRRLLSLLAAAPVALASDRLLAQAAKSVSTPPQPRSVPVEVQPISGFHLIDRSQARFGSLLFRGGLALASTDKEFGGLSGFHINDDGRQFLAISDKGNWFTGQIRYASNGSPAGIDGLVIAPMLGSDEKTLASKGWFDTESLAYDGDTAYVGIERVHRIVRFDFGREGVKADGVALNLPQDMRKLPNNRGIEALVKIPKGAPVAGELIAISERALDADGNIRAWIMSGVKGRQVVAQEFLVKRTGEYDVSDATMLPDGDLLLLERKFSWVRGAGIRIRRVTGASIAPGAVIDGPVIMEADLGYEIDNFEGIDSHIAADGQTVLTLISDDNFSFIQRTLLMQFTLLHETD